MARKMNWWTGGMTGERKCRQSINVLMSQDAEPYINMTDYCALLIEQHSILSYCVILKELPCLWSYY